MRFATELDICVPRMNGTEPMAVELVPSAVNFRGRLISAAMLALICRRRPVTFVPHPSTWMRSMVGLLSDWWTCSTSAPSVRLPWQSISKRACRLALVLKVPTLLNWNCTWFDPIVKTASAVGARTWFSVGVVVLTPERLTDSPFEAEVNDPEMLAPVKPTAPCEWTEAAPVVR